MGVRTAPIAKRVLVRFVPRAPHTADLHGNRSGVPAIEPLTDLPDESFDDSLDEDDLDGLPSGPSKSQLKREHAALQQLAERLAGMPRAELERLGLSEATWAALDETPRIKDLRARKRHWKRIANLLEREDQAAVRLLVEEKDEQARLAAARHHEIERWRERLIEEGDAALAELLDLHPGIERQPLRQLVRAAQRDLGRGRPDTARKLFRFLREALAEP